jgi:orotate phosphoribosyltransferase
MRYLLHVSDLHIGGPPSSVKVSAETIGNYIQSFVSAVRAAARGGTICGIVFGGDYVDKAWFLSCPDAVRVITRLMSELKIPRQAAAMCVGNHDLDFNKQDATFKSSGGQSGPARTAMYRPFLDGIWRPVFGASRKYAPISVVPLQGNITVLCIDTCQELRRDAPKLSSLPANALRQTQEELASCSHKSGPIAVVMHHPPMTVEPDHLGTRGAAEYIDKASDRIRIVLYGDQHELSVQSVENSFGRVFYAGCRSFGKFATTAARGAALIGFDDNDRVSRICDVFYTVDRNADAFYYGTWSHRLHVDAGEIKLRQQSFSDIQPVTPTPKTLKKIAAPRQAYALCNDEIALNLHAWVRQDGLLVQGRFAVHPGKLSVTWIDVERLLTDPKRFNAIAIAGADWVRRECLQLTKHVFVMGVDSNGAMLAARIGQILGLASSYCISRRRKPYHATYEARYNIPKQMSQVVLVTDVISSGDTIADIASELCTPGMTSSRQYAALSMFVSPSLSPIRNVPRVGTLCDNYEMDIVAKRNCSTDDLPLDLDLRAELNAHAATRRRHRVE